MILYAKWDINSYTVHFNSNGGSQVADKTATYNSAITVPTTNRTGYTLVGWYKDAEGKVAWNFAKDRVTANTTICAKWVAIPAKPSNAKLTKSGKDAVKLTWSKVSGATGYEIVKSTSKTGTFSHLSSVTTTDYTNKGLSKGKTYYYKIRSYKMVGSQKIYGEWTSVMSIKL
ncbi:InlB B-repeat-containing protein [Gottfriedia acidiceleris]|uniref:InlB B-repeat-containing protein n=1 Tax=Gottfriedia acidiceleris TaxID=371036 RepID=UPI002FFED9D1